MESIKLTVECTNWSNPKNALGDALDIAKAAKTTLWCKFKSPWKDGFDFDIRVRPTSDIADLWEIFDLKIEQWEKTPCPELKLTEKE